MDHAENIRAALKQVFDLRALANADAALGQAVATIKSFQAQRFRETYADLLVSKRFSAASHFFLDELYGDADYSERDTQFDRIAGTLTKVLPASVANATLLLAQVHALTEELDYQMAAQCVLRKVDASSMDSASYAVVWRAVGRRADRQLQLDYVLDIGQQLAGFTRKPGLSTLLRLMRGPAERAGLGSLQQFLEGGFGVFGAMVRTRGGADEFLETIRRRETGWMEAMYAGV